MSESKESSPKKLSRRAAALVGLAVVFVIALLVNFVVDRISFRADLTEYGVYTLSDGTSNILSRLETPVELRYYVTDDSKVMSPSERTRARRVSDLLAEFARNAPTKEIEVTNEAGEFEKKKVKMLTVKKAGNDITIDGAKIIASVRGSNGMVHVVDAVIVPAAK